MDSDRTILSPLTSSLFVVDSKGNRTEVSRELIAGREAGCDLMLDEGRCSRKHASLQPAPGGILVTDLGSSNGTFINGSRIEKGIAKAGDELGFDTARFRVEGNMPAAAQADVTTLIPSASFTPPPVEKPAEKPAVPIADKIAEKVAAKPAGNETSANESSEAQKGAWWAPKDEGPDGTLLMQSGIAAQPAAVEGTQVMAALSAAEPSLVGLSGSVKGQSFKFTGDRWKIGRDASECNIVLDDAGVSAFHAQIINEGATWKLINLMSSNGSFVNGQRVQTAYLNSGDRLQFGATEFIFNLGGIGAGALSGNATAADTVTVATSSTPGWRYAVIGFVVVALAGAALLLLK